jgi:hypothetical protein
MIANHHHLAVALALVAGACALDDVSVAPAELSAPGAGATRALWRYTHGATGAHHHTILRDDAALADAGFALPAAAGRLLQAPIGGALPIYALDPFNHGGKAESPEDPPDLLGYVLPAPVHGTVPLRHYVREDLDAIDHVYSLNPFEHGGGYEDKGIAGYVYP